MPGYIDYQPVADIFDAMRIETIDGMSVADMVGGGYPMPVAAHFMDILATQAGLGSGDRVLDIGCGCGRLAAAFTQHIGPHGLYCGVDIIAGLVDFANRHITPRYPTFTFLTLDRSNPGYDQWRHDGTSRTIATLEAACEPGSMTLVVATSLFTHLDTAMAREALAAAARALAPDGRALISLFLLDAGTRALINRGAAAFRFEHPHTPGVFVHDKANPTGALAFEHDHFIDLLTEAGLYVERLLCGNWPGRRHHVSGQDILVVRKV